MSDEYDIDLGEDVTHMFKSERREKKRAPKMKVHGKDFGEMYGNAIKKRIQKLESKHRGDKEKLRHEVEEL